MSPWFEGSAAYLAEVPLADCPYDGAEAVRWAEGWNHAKKSAGGKSHGTPGRYTAGCKCDICTDANTKRNAIGKAKRVGRRPLVHNASTYRNWGCNCTVCRADHQRVMNRGKELAGKGENHRASWTDADLEVVLDKPDGRRYRYTALEAALKVGRSVSAVNQQRFVARSKQRV